MTTSASETPFDGGRFLERMRGRRNRKRKPDTARATDPVQRQVMIAEAAYYRAERRSFEPGHELEDWAQAEAEIQCSLASRPPARSPC
ncbi:MAG: DUF2934 domain-containing protein [Steroidobacteraceae bacterium]